MSKKKLLVVAGAGASIELGMPSVSEVGDILSKKAQERYPLANEPDNNLYNWLARTVKDYWDKSGTGQTPNFEDLMHSIFLLSAVYPKGIFTSPLGAMVKTNDFPDIKLFGRTIDQANQNVWGHFSDFLTDTIIQNFREKCRHLHNERAKELGEIQQFFATLSKQFELSVVTVNYDNIINQSIPGLENGFDQKGIFNEKLLFNREQWPCILHLHGSVHFDMRHTKYDLHDIQWEPNLKTQFNQNAAGRSAVHADEGITFPQSVIIAGHGKTSQITRRPFRTYYSELDRLANQSDALISLGYGFGDSHLNQAFETYRDNRKRPVVIVDFADDNSISVSAAGNECNDPSGTIPMAMCVFKTDSGSMKALGYSTPIDIKDIKDQKAFVLSNDIDTPLSIWYNGMLEACRHPDKILAQLQMRQ